ncbi:hypothetical protein D3C86_1754100 [compost metagenome]
MLTCAVLVKAAMISLNWYGIRKKRLSSQVFTRSRTGAKARATRAVATIPGTWARSPIKAWVAPVLSK